MNTYTDYPINAIAKHLAYEIVEQESDVVSDPEKLEKLIQEKLTEFLR